MLQPLDVFITQGLFYTPIKVLVEDRVQRTIDQRRLTASGHARYTNEFPQWKVDVYFFKVMTLCSLNRQVFPISRSPFFGNHDVFVSEEVVGCEGIDGF